MAEQFLLPIKTPQEKASPAVQEETSPAQGEEFLLPEKTKANTLTLTPPEALPTKLSIGPIETGIELAPEVGAALVGAGAMMIDTYKGIKQMLGVDEEQMKDEQRYMDALYADPEVGKYAVGGSVVGALAEPVGFLLPAAKGKSVVKAVATAVGVGATYAGAGYVREGDSRVGNALLGGTIGGAAVGALKAAGGAIHASKVRQAAKTVDNVELAWARQIAAGEDPKKAYETIVTTAPELHKDLKKATEILGRKPKLVLSKTEAADIVKYYDSPVKATNLSIGKQVDKVAGVLSTRVKNQSEVVFGRLRKMEHNMLQETHKRLSQVDDFLGSYSKQVKGKEKEIVDRALLNGDLEVAERIMKKHGGDKLWEQYSKKVRPVLDELGDQLLAQGRITNKLDAYFPRVIKNKDGLFQALGKVQKTKVEEALQQAEMVARKRGYGLTPIEESEVINKVLKGYGPRAAYKPGFAKERKIQEVPEEFLSFYASPEESLHTYIHNAVIDIEKAKFFGASAKYNAIHGTNVLDIDKSVGEIVLQEMKAGKLSAAQASELEGLLQVRLGIGDRAAAGLIQNTKNLLYSFLLANPISAATQLGDLGVAIYMNGFRNTLKAVAKSLTGKATITAKDFGLIDHLAEEFATTRKTAKWLNTTLKLGMFQKMDVLGKETLLNGSLSKYRALAKTEKGRAKIAGKYQKVFEDDYDLLLDDLRTNTITDRVKLLLFNELSDVQPISKSEMPEMYLRMPNGRVMYMLKTFMLKQLDIVRRDGYNEIKKGNVGKGMKNLMTYGLVVGSANTAAQVVKDGMSGKDVDVDIPYDIGENLLKTFGWSEYIMNKIKAGKPVEAAFDIVVPPYKVFDKLFTEDWEKYMPVAGSIYYYWFDGGIEKAAEKKFAEETKLDLEL